METTVIKLGDLLSQQLTSTQVINGRLIQIVATPAGEDTINLEVGYPFPPASTLRVVLKILDPHVLPTQDTPITLPSPAND